VPHREAWEHNAASDRMAAVSSRAETALERRPPAGTSANIPPGHPTACSACDCGSDTRVVTIVRRVDVQGEDVFEEMGLVLRPAELTDLRDNPSGALGRVQQTCVC